MPNLIAQLTHPEDLPVVGRFVQGIIEDSSGSIHQAEYRFKNKEGQYQWLRCYAVAYKRDSTGQPTHLLGVAYDITKEKDITDALQKSEKQLLEAQAIARIGSYEWNIDADTSVSSPQLRKIFEAESRQNFAEMMDKVHPDDKEKLRVALAASFTTGEFHCEYRYLAPSGEKVIDARGVVSFDESRKPLTLVGTIQDITIRKSVEESLLQKTLELEHSNERLQEFATVASHDLKEPLRKIGMFSNIIMASEWDNLPEKTKGNIQKISDAAARMQQLIEGILSYSAIDAQAEKQSYSLEEALQEAITNLEYRINDTNATVTSDGLPQAVVYPFQMQQLFQNLIANALKFSKKEVPPRIHISHTIVPPEDVKEYHLQPSDRYLQISVTDNGIGFNEAAREKIFGLFQRLHSKAAYEGSGLGLAICRRIVEKHGGVIYATSQEQVGSTFIITLPT